MTTEVEALAELHEWLAEKLPELRSQCFGFHSQFNSTPSGTSWSTQTHQDAGCPGWVPNVTTDGLLEALRERSISRVTIFMTDPTLGPGMPDRTRIHLLPLRGQREPYGGGETAHEALCRAAKKALEASA